MKQFWESYRNDRNETAGKQSAAIFRSLQVSLKQPSCKHYAHLNFSHGWLVACFPRTHLYI